MFQVTAIAPAGHVVALPELYTRIEANILMDSLEAMGFSETRAYGSTD